MLLLDVDSLENNFIPLAEGLAGVLGPEFNGLIYLTR